MTSLSPPISPLAPDHFPEIEPVAGVRLAVAAAGVRYQGRDDVLIAELAPGTACAGVFTRSQTAAAPVIWSRRAASHGRARVLVVNAGNANAYTGLAGEQAVQRTVEAAAVRFGCKPTEVLVASTGVIGEPLPAEKIVAVFDGTNASLGDADWQTAAETIATTDTFAKGAGEACTIDNVRVVISGIAKGAGMIAPDMATMLAFVFTDAGIAAEALQALVAAAAGRTFNAITVDGDTSTNDTLLAFATGAAGHEPITDAGDPRLDGFKAALEMVMVDLAQQIVRDGEGASKFVTITVTGAEDDHAARRIGLAIANSPLVKTAIAGEDANWGRIVMAVGKAGEKIAPARLAIRIGGVLITEKGGVVTGYDEAPVAAHMKGREVMISVDVGVGAGEATVWTCDLTHGYIDINADYRS